MGIQIGVQRALYLWHCAKTFSHEVGSAVLLIATAGGIVALCIAAFAIPR
jgi:hypothetical protein